MREVVDRFNVNLEKNYKPGPYLCIDEQLIEYNGRVKFRQYIPSKPGKFGIKVFWITDSENSFPLRCLVYVGKQTFPEGRDRVIPLAETVVMTLSRPFLQKRPQHNC